MKVSEAKPGDRIQTLLTGFAPESPSRYNTYVVLYNGMNRTSVHVMLHDGSTKWISSHNNCRIVSEDDIREY